MKLRKPHIFLGFCNALQHRAPGRKRPYVNRTQEVGGSNPLVSTISPAAFRSVTACDVVC